jgi:hypothetical protein
MDGENALRAFAEAEGIEYELIIARRIWRNSELDRPAATLREGEIDAGESTPQ